MWRRSIGELSCIFAALAKIYNHHSRRNIKGNLGAHTCSKRCIFSSPPMNFLSLLMLFFATLAATVSGACVVCTVIPITWQFTDSSGGECDFTSFVVVTTNSQGLLTTFTTDVATGFTLPTSSKNGAVSSGPFYSFLNIISILAASILSLLCL